MATITGFTAARMLQWENATVIDGNVVGNDLILVRKDGSQINAGSVRGPVGPVGPIGPNPNPTGTFIMGGWTTDPSGYLILNGRNLSGGATTYSALAAMFPNWVSGTNLILPDAAGSVPMGAASGIGVVSGSNQHTLSIANMPSHQHSGPSHAHIMSHNHSASSGTESHDHAHQIPNHQHGAAGVNGGEGYGYRIPSSNAGIDIYNAGGANVQWITHPASSYSGGGDWTGGRNQPHTHGITVDWNYMWTNPDGTQLTGPSGSGVAVNHTPKNMTVRFAVKT